MLTHPRILVVEDEPLARLAICEHLERLKFHVLEAGSGESAITILKRIGSHVDLIFSDVRMPGKIDGFGLADWVHRNLPCIPLILTSGHIQERPMHHLATGDMFLPKPYGLRELTARLCALVTSRCIRQAANTIPESRDSDR